MLALSPDVGHHFESFVPHHIAELDTGGGCHGFELDDDFPFDLVFHLPLFALGFVPAPGFVQLVPSSLK